jgi:hypothetical protein
MTDRPSVSVCCPLACFSGTGGAWGLVPVAPTATVRLQSASNLLATTNFTLIEVGALASSRWPRSPSHLLRDTR